MGGRQFPKIGPKKPNGHSRAKIPAHMADSEARAETQHAIWTHAKRLFGWDGFGFIFLSSVGVAMLSMDEFAKARLLFWVAAISLATKGSRHLWKYAGRFRYGLIIALCVGAIFFQWLYVLPWVKVRKDAYLASQRPSSKPSLKVEAKESQLLVATQSGSIVQSHGTTDSVATATVHHGTTDSVTTAVVHQSTKKATTAAPSPYGFACHDCEIHGFKEAAVAIGKPVPRKSKSDCPQNGIVNFKTDRGTFHDNQSVVENNDPCGTITTEDGNFYGNKKVFVNGHPQSAKPPSEQ
jgi:hypothetical protein